MSGRVAYKRAIALLGPVVFSFSIHLCNLIIKNLIGLRNKELIKELQGVKNFI
jgi:hypothetical protein